MDSPRMTITLFDRIRWLLVKATRLSADYWDCENTWELSEIVSALQGIQYRYELAEFRIATPSDLADVDVVYYRLNQIEKRLIDERTKS